MPVRKVTKGGKPGFRWGMRGKVYTYTAGNPSSRNRARRLAEKQGKAIQSRKGRDKEQLRVSTERTFQPDKISDRYDRKLQSRNELRQLSVRKSVLDALDRISRVRGDASEELLEERSDTVKILQAAIAKASRDWSNRSTISQAFLGQIGRQTDRHSQFETVKMIIGVDEEALRRPNELAKSQRRKAIRAFIRENTKLIKSVDERYFDQIADDLTDAYLKGATARKMAQIMNTRKGVSDANTERIARDQTQKLNNLLARQQITYAGAEHYEWVTSQDNRVRDTHFDNNRKIFSWDDPPDKTGHPGNDVNCRCVALAVFDDDPRLTEYKSKKANPTNTVKGASDFLKGEGG